MLIELVKWYLALVLKFPNLEMVSILVFEIPKLHGYVIWQHIDWFGRKNVFIKP
jgi:hypothetical protein